MLPIQRDKLIILRAYLTIRAIERYLLSKTNDREEN